MSRALRLAWRAVYVAYGGSAVIFLIAGLWSLLGFSLVWGVGFGALAYRCRGRFASAMRSAGLGGYLGFALTAIAITIVEESLCAGFGCRLAYPVLAVDLLVVGPMWLVWLTGWWFFVAPRYRFEPDEALLVAASTGVFFETFGTGYLFRAPLYALLSIGPVIMVYAAIAVLPLSLVDWRGTREGTEKRLFALLVPFLLTLPVAVAAFALLSAAGVRF